MHFVVGSEFCPAPPQQVSDAPLVVHTRPDSSHDHLAIFLHGLGGRRYATWGELPRFLFEDCCELDIGLYDYPSGVRGLLRWGTPMLPDLAKEIADTVRDAPHQHVVFIGHSMGGLLAKAVVKDLLDSGAHTRGGHRVVDRVAGLVLVATPQAGSLRVPAVLGLLTRDGRTLKAHSKFVTELAETFETRVAEAPEYVSAASGRVYVPVFGVIGNRDAWVDRLSASLGLSRNRTKNVRASHTSIVKPRSRDDGAYQWILETIQACLARERRFVEQTGVQSETADAARHAGRPTVWRGTVTFPDGTMFTNEAYTERAALQLGSELMRYLRDQHD